MQLSIPLKSLKDDKQYFIELEDGVWLIPIATGREIKKRWKDKHIKEFDHVDRKPANGYTLVACDEDRYISVKPFGSEYISLAQELQKLKEATNQIFT